MLNFAVNLSLIFSEVPLLERFQAAADIGFKYVEIQFPYEYSAKQLKSAAEAAGVEIVLFNLPAADLMTGGEGLACVPSRVNEFDEALEKAVEYAHVLQPRWLNVLAGRNHNEQEKPIYQKTLVRNLKKALQRVEGLSFDIVTEAINNKDMPGFLVNTFKQMLEIKQQPGCEALKLQYDLYHMARMDQPIEEQLRRYIADIGHIQFADCPGRHEPGTGDFHLAEIFTLIDALPYSGFVAAEYNPSGKSKDSFDWFNS